MILEVIPKNVIIKIDITEDIIHQEIENIDEVIEVADEVIEVVDEVIEVVDEVIDEVIEDKYYLPL
jgi:hypothetical protein